jgi:hypothetical protein
MNRARLFALVTPHELTHLPELDDILSLNDDERMIRMHFTHKQSNLEWFVLAYDKTRKEFFGLANSFELQLRPFTLHDIRDVVRDKGWRKQSLATVRRKLIARRAGVAQ